MPALVRPVEERDRSAIEGILRRAGNFTPVEIETALELIGESLDRGDDSGYFVSVLEEDAEASGVRGYVCFGPVPLTEGTFDLYWIAVDPASQGRGYGQRLLRFAEDEVARRGGRWLIIETSSQESYGATQRFYERAGYELMARLPEYYRPDDDKLIFGKRLDSSSKPK